jgi:hypothetical protein
VLRLNEAAAATVQRLDPEAVLPIEDAGNEKTAEPAQLDCANRGLERGRPPSRRLDSDLEPRTFTKFAAYPADEGFHSSQ